MFFSAHIEREGSETGKWKIILREMYDWLINPALDCILFWSMDITKMQPLQSSG
jgi:hypothetical protein